MSQSTNFQYKPPAGARFRLGESGKAWQALYAQLDAAFHAVEQTATGVPTSRTIATTAPLAGGGNLSTNRTLTIADATNSSAGAATAAQITALEGLQRGKPTVRTVSLVGSTSETPVAGLASSGVEILTASAESWYTPPTLEVGQEILIFLGSNQTVHLTGVSGALTAAGDFVKLLGTADGNYPLIAVAGGEMTTPAVPAP